MAFSIFVVTDTHLFENSLGASGEAYEKRSRTDQKCIAETGAILEATFKQMSEDESVDTIIIVGDLVYRAEKESHISFRKMLYELKEKGKKIYIVTARHDYATAEPDYVSHPVGFVGNELVPVEGLAREELREFYKDFGFDEAISEHKTLSYCVQLNDKIRLLAINCDGDFHSFKGLYDDQMEWIYEQINKAKQDGCYIFAMMHYPLLPGASIMELIEDAKLTDWKKRATELADAGLDLIFTGHMHMQSLNSLTTEKGNTIYDICTGSIVGCPGAYRKVTFNDNGVVNIRSLEIADFDWDKGGKSAKEYLQWRFDRLLTDIIDGMAYDFPVFASKLGGAEKLKPLKPLVTFVGKLLQKLTLGGVGKMFFFRVDDSIKDILLKDLAVELVRNIFVGDQPYTEDTAVYKATMKLLKRLRPVIFIVEKKLGKKNPLFEDIPAFLASLIGDEKKMDWNCDIKVDF